MARTTPRIDGSYYLAPGVRPGTIVRVHINPVCVQIFAPSGALVATHAVPDQPTRLFPAPDLPGSQGPGLSRPAQEAHFLVRFQNS